MDLLENPFNILSASPRDSRRRIMELAEEQSLLGDSVKCEEARITLTNPRKRLSAEVAWLPGVGPKRTAELLALVESSPADLLDVDNLPPISRANLLAAGLIRLPNYNSDDIAEWILGIAIEDEYIDPEKLCALINEERVVSGFPEISDILTVETEIQERRRYYRRTIESALNKLPPAELVKTVTAAIETATDNGKEQAPGLIDDLVDSYEAQAQEFFDKEGENIATIIEEIQDAADNKSSDSVLAPMVDKLIKVVRNWDIQAQPIQVSAMSRGLKHDASIRTAKQVRNLALYLFNEHDKLNFSIQITEMLQNVFAEVGEVVERVDDDIDQLGEIAEKREWLDPIVKLVEEAYNNINKNPSLGYREAQKILNATPELIAKMETAKPGISVVQKNKDTIAILLMHCAIAYGNKTGKWEKVIGLFREALDKYAMFAEVKSQIQKNLDIAVNNLSNQEISRDAGAIIRVIVERFGVVLVILVIVGIVAICESINDRSASRPAKNVSYSERNVPPTTYALAISAADGGTVSPAMGRYTYNSGTSVSITATANRGYTFVGWTGAKTETTNPITITMDGDQTISANFKPQTATSRTGNNITEPPTTYTLYTSATGGGIASPLTGTYTYMAGVSVTVTATPYRDYTFTGWTGAKTGIANPVTITMDGNKTLMANFISQREKWINNSLSTGATPYSNLYGGNRSCNRYGCSQIKVTTSNHTDVLVTIKQNGKVVRHAYIRSGDSFAFNVPDGTYQPFFYYGKGWNPEKVMKQTEEGIIKGGFIENESFGKDFPQTLQNQSLEYQLILQQHGNFSTKPSNANDAL